MGRQGEAAAASMLESSFPSMLAAQSPSHNLEAGKSTDVAVQCGQRSGPACSSRILRFLSCHGKSSQCLQDLTQRPKPRRRSVEAGGAWPASGIIGLRASGHAWSTRLMLDYQGGT
ncbi:uncharacterized protein LOC144107990 [Amblyomma americanum]